MAVTRFFLGKGGVGKSTTAALTAVGLARRGLDVVVVSLDPAHNLGDVLGVELSDRERQVRPGLRAIEVDRERWVHRYLEGVEERIESAYRYLTAFNLTRHLEVLWHAPGLEEHALLLAFVSARERFAGADALVVDMPPTALAVKFFTLPSLSLVWARHLAKLRQEIIDKRELITRVRWPGREVETDRVMRRLEEEIAEQEQARALFGDAYATRITLVTNPDELAFAESRRIVEELDAVGIGPSTVLLNRAPAENDRELKRLRAEVPVPETVSVPPADEPLIGLDALERFLEAVPFPVGPPAG